MNEALLGALLALSLAFGVAGVYALHMAMTLRANLQVMATNTQNGFNSVAQHVGRVEDHVNAVGADLDALEFDMQSEPGQVVGTRVH